MAAIVPVDAPKRTLFGLHFHNAHVNWMEKLKRRYQEDKTMSQWCKLKENNMTELIFVKRGLFYEVYHNDADVCYVHFHMPFMKGDDAHSGIPDVSFAGKCVYLEELGYTVRVLNADE